MTGSWTRCLVSLSFLGAVTVSCGDAASSDATGGGSNSGGVSSAGGSGGGDGSASGATSGGGSDNGEGSGGSNSGGGSDHAASGGDGSDSGGSNGSGGAGSPHARSACKRGLGYGYHTKADLEALRPGVSWWYNWAFVPDEALADGSYLEQDVEYVPMIWGSSSDRAAALEDIPDDAATLLGFNEPNFGSQADLSASDAAALWPELEIIADALDLDLISPAVNFCGGDCQETDPFAYLDEFLAACTGCRVDALAIHIYVGCAGEGDNQAQWLVNHVETYKSRFTHPLWLTEFACDDASSEDEQIAFMEDAVEFLEGEPRIARYAWFAGRADNVAHVDLLGADGELTALGQRYVELAQPSECQR